MKSIATLTFVVRRERLQGLLCGGRVFTTVSGVIERPVAGLGRLSGRAMQEGLGYVIA